MKSNQLVLKETRTTTDNLEGPMSDLVLKPPGFDRDNIGVKRILEEIPSVQ